jgi:periplasmic protein CpxP/Spy
MKLKNLSVVAAAIALSLTPMLFGAQAQANSSSNSVIAQAQKPGAKRGIQLTEGQKKKIDAIRTETRTKIEGIFTDQQKQQLQAAIQSGQSPRQAFGALQLSTKQQQDIQEVLVSSNKKMESVLTDEQKRQLIEMQQGAGTAPQTQPKK